MHWKFMTSLLKQKLKLALTCLTMAVLAVACKTKEKPVAKEEATTLGKEIEKSVSQKNATYLDDAIDVKSIVNRMKITSGKSLINENGFEKGIKEKMILGKEIIRSIGAKGSYKMIRCYSVGDTQHVLFRMYGNGSVNYHDFELTHVKGVCKIADVYVYLSGENLSETLANLYKQFDATGFNDNDMASLKKINEIRKMYHSSRFSDAKEAIEKLPYNIRNMKPVMLLNIMICGSLENNDSIYEKALEDYKAVYPQEANMDLLSIDGYFLQKKYDKVMTSINKLDKALGGDPFLDFYRYACYKMLEDKPGQKESLERLVKNMPDFEEGYQSLIGFYLEEATYDKAAQTLATYKKHPEFDIETMNTLVAMYPGFKAK